MGGSFQKNDSSSQGSGWNAGNTGGVQGGINGSYGLNQSGNFGQNQSSSTSSGTSASTQNVYGAQEPYLQDVYQQAQGAFNQGMADVNGLKPEAQAQLGAAVDAAGAGYGNQLGGGFASGLAGQLGPNTYTDGMKQQIANDAMKMKQQNLGSLDARAAASGMSGSSGYRDQVGKMMADTDENALNAMTNVGYNSFNQGIQNQMQLAGMMDQNQQAGLGNLNSMQQGVMNQFNPMMLGQQMAGQYAQTIGGPTTLNNSFSQNSANSNSLGTNMGFSNGMNMGLGINGGYNFGNNYGGQTNTSDSSGRGVGVSLG